MARSAEEAANGKGAPLCVCGCDKSVEWWQAWEAEIRAEERAKWINLLKSALRTPDAEQFISEKPSTRP